MCPPEESPAVLNVKVAAPFTIATAEPEATLSTSNWTVPVGTGGVPVPMLPFATLTLKVTLPPPLTPHWGVVVVIVVEESSGQGFAGDGFALVTGVQFSLVFPVGVTRLHEIGRAHV